MVIVAALAVIVTGVTVKAPEYPSSGIVILPHPKEYNLYYICQDTICKSTIYKCPDDLHFNNTIKQCDWSLAGRFPRMNPKTESDEEKAGKSNCVGTCPILNPEDKTILLPYRGDCKFCSCNNGTPIVLSCPSSLHFHEAEQVYNWPWIVDCPW